MGRRIIDRSARPKRSARLGMFAALERRPGGSLTPLFENLFRRARRVQAEQGRLPRYIAIARRG